FFVRKTRRDATRHRPWRAAFRPQQYPSVHRQPVSPVEFRAMKLRKRRAPARLQSVTASGTSNGPATVLIPFARRQRRVVNSADRMADIVLTTLNAKYIHAAFGLRYLLANLCDSKSR